MKWAALPVVFVVGVIVALHLSNTVFAPPPAATRLAGVTVSVSSYSINNLTEDRRRLKLTVRVSSVSDLDECMAFTLDTPFANRRISDPPAGCVKPQAGAVSHEVHFDQLTADDFAFPQHTLVWGIPGGRCGVLMGMMGVCVVEQVGTVPVNLPWRTVIPTFAPIGTFGPLFSFDPLP